MKIKNKVGKISPNAIMLIMGIVTMVAVPLRSYQMANLIDSSTGFYNETDFTVPLLYGLLFAAGLIMFVLSFLCGRLPEPVMLKDKNIPIGIASAVFAVALLADAVFKMNTCIGLFESSSSSNAGTGSYLLTSGALFIAFETLFAILSSIYFVILSSSYFNGNTKYENSRILAVFPVIWAICRIIYRFVKPINYKNVSQLLLEIFMIVFMMGFLLSFARIASKINEEKSMWMLYGCGSVAAMLSFVCAFAPFTAIITGNAYLISFSYPMQYCDLGFAIFSTTVLTEYLKNAGERKSVGVIEDV